MLPTLVIRTLIELSLTVDSATGGATMTRPQGGFNNSLDAVFSQTVPLSSTSPTGVLSSKDPPPSPNSSASVGAIVGGILGGVAAILIAIGLFFYLRRRKAQQAAQSEKSELGPSNERTNDQGIYSKEYKHHPGRHEVPGDFVQRDTAHPDVKPEVHELGPEHRVPQLP